jgi:periplasmic protein TonB
MELHKIQNSDYLDILFEHRNQAYGAYTLRKGYQKTVKRAIFIGSALFLGLLLVPFYAFTHRADFALPVVWTPVTPVVLPPPPEKVKEKPVLPKQEIIKKEELPVFAQPVKTTEFKPPVVVPDQEALKTPPKIADFKDAVAAQTTQTTGTTGSAALPTTPKGGTAAVPFVDEDEPKEKADEKPFIVVEERPSFPGGERALMQWLADNIKYNAMAREVGAEGKVFLRFVVEKNGEITDIKVMRGLGYGLDESAVNAVKTMPRWTAGKQNGRNVRVQFTLPVQFKLE